MKKIVVIGSSNVDYIGKATSKIIASDSNIGSIRINFGGVGRNICENLARLGANVTFITAFGCDNYGQVMREQLEELGAKTYSPVTSLGSASYMAIHDQTGEMKLAVNDLAVIDTINQKYLEEMHTIIDSCDILVIDANISKDAIEYLADKYSDKQIIVDAISTTKVMKLLNCLDKLYLLKCNRMEANQLNSDWNKISSKNLIVSNGSSDIFCRSDKIDYVPVVKTSHIRNVTGAGDALLSGVIYGISKGLSLLESLEIGKKMAVLNLESDYTVYPLKGLDELL